MKLSIEAENKYNNNFTQQQIVASDKINNSTSQQKGAKAKNANKRMSDSKSVVSKVLYLTNPFVFTPVTNCYFNPFWCMTIHILSAFGVMEFEYRERYIVF